MQQNQWYIPCVYARFYPVQGCWKMECLQRPNMTNLILVTLFHVSISSFMVVYSTSFCQWFTADLPPFHSGSVNKIHWVRGTTWSLAQWTAGSAADNVGQAVSDPTVLSKIKLVLLLLLSHAWFPFYVFVKVTEVMEMLGVMLGNF